MRSSTKRKIAIMASDVIGTVSMVSVLSAIGNMERFVVGIAVGLAWCAASFAGAIASFNLGAVMRRLDKRIKKYQHSKAIEADIRLDTLDVFKNVS